MYGVIIYRRENRKVEKLKTPINIYRGHKLTRESKRASYASLHLLYIFFLLTFCFCFCFLHAKHFSISFIKWNFLASFQPSDMATSDDLTILGHLCILGFSFYVRRCYRYYLNVKNTRFAKRKNYSKCLFDCRFNACT